MYQTPIVSRTRAVRVALAAMELATQGTSSKTLSTEKYIGRNTFIQIIAQKYKLGHF